MKQRYISLMLSVVVLFLSAGILFVHGQQETYSGPDASFPNGLKSKPVDTSNSGQEKPGDLNLKTLRFGLNTDSNATNVALSGKISHAINGSFIDLNDLSLGVNIQNSTGPISLSAFGPLALYTKGLRLPIEGGAQSPAGTIYYNSSEKKVKLCDKTNCSAAGDWTDIGTGTSTGGGTNTLQPTVKLTGDSGSVGMIFNENEGTGGNSPMLMFSVYGNAPVSMFSNKKIAKSFFKDLIPTAEAITVPACDPESFNCGETGGGGSGGGYTDPLTKPVWWMRQEGTKFYIKASDPQFSDVRDVFELTKGGTLTTGDLNVVSPKWSTTGSEIQSTGGERSYSPDGHMENWVTCPDGYFVSAFRLGKSGDYLTPVIKCSKL